MRMLSFFPLFFFNPSPCFYVLTFFSLFSTLCFLHFSFFAFHSSLCFFSPGFPLSFFSLLSSLFILLFAFLSLFFIPCFFPFVVRALHSSTLRPFLFLVGFSFLLVFFFLLSFFLFSQKLISFCSLRILAAAPDFTFSAY